MTSLERIRIGQKAPNFRCQALVSGSMQGACYLDTSMLMVKCKLIASRQTPDTPVEVSLETYINPSGSRDAVDAADPWLVMLFVPAAFSHSCPIEVLAFQDSFAQFQSRNCSIIFISVDTRKLLWYWQSIPRKHGGLGHVDIPLLSDTDNRIAKDYGVVIEELGIDIRGMFLIDGEGIVQQVSDSLESVIHDQKTGLMRTTFRRRWIIARLTGVSLKLYAYSMHINRSPASATLTLSTGFLTRAWITIRVIVWNSPSQRTNPQRVQLE
jgi:alkyl hydroperoxide reductase subunit AhpC